VAVLIFVFVFTHYVINRSVFTIFSYPLKMSLWGHFHFYYYVTAILSTSLLLCFWHNVVLVPMVPIFLLFLSVILLRPYKKWYENLRSAYILAVVLCFFGLQVHTQHNNNIITSDTYVFLLVDTLLLLLGVIGTVVSLVYYAVFKYIILPGLQKSVAFQVVKKLSETNVEEKLGYFDKENIFKTIIKSKTNILNFSNKLSDIFTH
jgi:hypothetical protein